jgi:tight adherence protein B
MIYLLYAIFVIIIACVFIITFFLAEKNNDKNNVATIIKKHKPIVLTNSALNLSDANRTDKNTQAILNKLRSLDQSEKNGGKVLFQNFQYKLTYVYGDNIRKNFIILLCKCMGIIFVLCGLIKMMLLLSIIISIILGIIVSIMITNRSFDKKIAHFLNNFGYSLDVIVRGIKTGLSLVSCFKQIANESEPVVAEQFFVILDDYKLGMNTDQVMERFMKRMPLKEVCFFSLSIIVQAKTGGDLADIILSLSKVLKNRKSLLVRIQVLSSEAKMSAIIMGCIPIFIIGAIGLIDPKYVSIFFDTLSGNIVLGACLTWMIIGGLIMRSMINFYR